VGFPNFCQEGSRGISERGIACEIFKGGDRHRYSLAAKSRAMFTKKVLSTEANFRRRRRARSGCFAIVLVDGLSAVRIQQKKISGAYTNRRCPGRDRSHCAY